MEQLVGSDLKLMLAAGARMLENNKEMINAMNTFPVPDGDTGTNMCLTMRSALNEVKKVEEDSVSAVGTALSTGSLLGARGNSGVILSQIFRGFAKGLEGKNTVTPREFALALQSGVHAAYKAVMKPVEGTMLTIARESAKEAMASAGRGRNFIDLLREMIQHAEKVLEKTPDMLPVLKEAGVVDAGGKGLIEIYRGFLLQLQGEEIPELVMAEEEVKPLRPQEVFQTEDIVYGYCTELIVQGDNLQAEEIRTEISHLGDSVIVVGDENVVKIHIHTNNPGQILEKCIKHGTLHKIKVDNMREQHEHLLEESKSPAPVADGMAVVAVAAGEGLAKIFESLGVKKVIYGGQTMNPSTEDILQAVKEVPQNEIIILPNNKNIVLAAKQVNDLVGKEVRVVETRSIPQGIAAMLAFSDEEKLNDNVTVMERARQKVQSAAVTFAVCDSKVNGLDIHENDIIGLKEDNIVVVGQQVGQIVKDLLAQMVNEDTEIITLYAGDAVPAEDAAELQAELATIFANCDVELYDGNQPFYYYIISVE
ncbi:MAG: DAK2 domain-containing protein [Firmicutes bacterium]|nr:DAK2 domain-containing protein [Bacillota bacterium]